MSSRKELQDKLKMKLSSKQQAPKQKKLSRRQKKKVKTAYEEHKVTDDTELDIIQESAKMMMLIDSGFYKDVPLPKMVMDLKDKFPVFYEKHKEIVVAIVRGERNLQLLKFMLDMKKKIETGEVDLDQANDDMAFMLAKKFAETPGNVKKEDMPKLPVVEEEEEGSDDDMDYKME